MSSLHLVRNQNAQHGVVLPGVLWIAVLAMVIAVNYSTDIHLNIKVADNIKTTMTLKHDAISAIYIALDSTLSNPVTTKTHYELPINDSLVKVEVMPESMKTDLNTADPAQLSNAFIDAGLAEEKAEILADRVIDWRDRDHSRRFKGGEDDDYLAEGRDYGAKDSRFDDLAELLLLDEISPADFQQISNNFTTYGRSSGKLFTLSAKAQNSSSKQIYQINTIVQLTYQSNKPYRILKWQFNQS